MQTLSRTRKPCKTNFHGPSHDFQNIGIVASFRQERPVEKHQKRTSSSIVSHIDCVCPGQKACLLTRSSLQLSLQKPGDHTLNTRPVAGIRKAGTLQLVTISQADLPTLNFSVSVASFQFLFETELDQAAFRDDLYIDPRAA